MNNINLPPSFPHQELPLKPTRQRLELHNPDEIFIIQEGKVDLYAVENIEGEPIGVHYFIGEFTQGSWLFSFSEKNQESQYSITAFLKGKSRLIKISKKNLINQGSLFYPLLAGKINKWSMSLLFSFANVQNGKENEKIMFPGESALLKKNDVITLSLGDDHESLLAWVHLKKGTITDSLNSFHFSAGDIFPFISKQFYIILNDSEVELLPTENILNQNWALYLDTLHLFFLKGFSNHENVRKNFRYSLVHSQEKQEKELLQNSLKDLVTVLNQEIVVSEYKDSPIMSACKKIGEALDINFVKPATLSEDLRQQVIEICQTSNIRYRQIYLPEGWRKDDSGPFLSFYQINNQLVPVAILLNSKGEYTFEDPLTGQNTIVSAANEDLFSQTGYIFYPSLPSHSLRARDLLIFGLKKQRSTITMFIFIALGVVLLNAFTPIASQIIFGTIIPELNKNFLWQIGSGLFIAAISSTIFIFTRGYLMLRINALLSIRLECAKWDRVLNFPVNFFNNYTVGELSTKLYSLTRIRQLFNESFLSLLITAIFSFLYLILMFFYSFYLTLSVLGVLIIVLLISLICIKINYKIQQNVISKKGELSGFLLQAITGISKLKTMGAEKKAFAHWGNRFAKLKKLDLRSQNILTILNTVMAMLPTIIYLTIFVFMTYWILDSINNPTSTAPEMDFGNFFGFVAAYGAFSAAIFALMPALTQSLGTIRPNWNWTKVLFETEPVLDQAKKNPGKLLGQLSLDKISFRYDKKGDFILKDISLKANPGEFIAIVGPSGCGKSTLLRLLLGFEIPEVGSVYYDYQDLLHLNLKEVRKQLGVVLQSGAIISGSIYENIACGSLYTPQQVMDALKLAAFDKDMHNFPMGIYTMLPSGGTTITGGQRQRLLIARALVGKPKILLFDEATSALDNASQETITQNIEALNVTRVVIAHRLSTIKNADRIYVIDEGQVVQEGTFEELSKEPGLFKYLIERQKV